MKVTIKMLQGSSECTIKLSGSTTVAELKVMMEELLMVAQNAQRLVFRGKTLTDESTLEAAGISDGSKIHLMVMKTDNSSNIPTSIASSSKSNPSSKSPSPAQHDLFFQVDALLRKHLTAEQTTKVVGEFRKNISLMIDSMNFEDIERFAASNFTEF